MRTSRSWLVTVLAATILSVVAACGTGSSTSPDSGGLPSSQTPGSGHPSGPTGRRQAT